MIVIINGSPQSGKDTFCNYCKENIGEKYCYSFSTVDFIKNFLVKCGWNGIKDDNARIAISEIKKALVKLNDIPFTMTCKEIRSICDTFEEYGINEKEYIIFVHCREIREIEKFKRDLDAKTVFIDRNLSLNLCTDSDREAYHSLTKYNYDYIIKNNSSLDELKRKSKIFCKIILHKK